MPVGALESALAEKFEQLLPHLNERQRRLAVAADARSLGHGGISIAARASGLSRPTIYKALVELDDEAFDAGWERAPGAGRKKASTKDPLLIKAIDDLIDGGSRGDPASSLRWTIKSTRNIADQLRAKGHPVSANTVDGLLHELGFSLQANAKVVEGDQHPDRDAQFRYIESKVRSFRRSHDPIISVDSKKKELVGRYKNAGQEWKPSGRPTEVKTHDFIDKQLGKVIPYGIYDVGNNRGWVEVGVDHDTATFAVHAIRTWWLGDGAPCHPAARRLLITADSGGSNSARSRLWKKEIAILADEIKLPITVCHFPPGTSKWNKIEHRLFSQITSNWRGQPLTSREVVVGLIGATTTSEGLAVHAELDRHKYPKGVKITDAEIQELAIEHHKFHGEWNYTAKPKSEKRVKKL